MKKQLAVIFISIMILLLPFFTNANDGDSFFEKTDALLKEHVKNGFVDYKSLHKNPSELDKLVQIIRKFDISELPEGDAQKAFWLNTYNILVIKRIISNYPINSPLDIDGFFNKIKYTAAGRELTLDKIENNIIRPTYKDARIHFALVCAAKSCPPITHTAFFPGTLDAQLNQNSQKILNDANFIKVTDDEKSVEISQIFEWFAVDFEMNGKMVLEYINDFRKDEIPADYTVKYYPYNWSLNEL